MTVAAAGVWNLHSAISSRWTEKALDATFRAEWTTPSDTAHQPLNDTTQLPNTPFPYCVFEVEKPVTLGHCTGAGANHTGTERKFVRVGVSFVIYAKRTTAETAKSIAKRMLVKVCDAFDPGAGAWSMPDGSDYFMRVERAAEWLIRGDENTHEGGVRYEVFLDEVFARRTG